MTDTPITIEKGHRVPPRRSKYQFGKMRTGDSIFVADGVIKQQSLRNIVHYHMKRNGILLTVRRVEGGFRVWRLPQPRKRKPDVTEGN